MTQSSSFQSSPVNDSDLTPNDREDDSAPNASNRQLIQRMESTIGALEEVCERAADEHLDRGLNANNGTGFCLSIIIPVYNERQTLPKILDRIDEVMPEGTQTIVVDDASTDGTAEWLIAQTPRPDRTILRRGCNHGKGSAVRLGIRHSRGKIVAIQDADSEYDPADLLSVIKPIETGDSQVVYGSRYLTGSDDPSLIHRLGNWALTAASNCMTGQRLTDMETCHKAFSGDLIRSIGIRECRFGFEPEITGKIAEQGVQIREVPTGYQYRSYDEGKKITWKDGVAAFVCMWRYRTPGWTLRTIRGIGRVIQRIPRLVFQK